MNKTLLSLFFLGILHSMLSAQPLPCGPVPAMTPLCMDACIICDINGFTGINNDPTPGVAPPDFCTTVAHHVQWIGFIAGSTNLKLAVRVYNCDQGDGLEVGIYESFNCTTFRRVSNCNSDMREGGTYTFTNTVPLVIGQYYYFVMDGNRDDVCNYTITVLEGTTAVGILPNSGVLAGNQTVCPGQSEIYTLDPPSGATWFSWSLNGVTFAAGQDSTLSLDWTVPGENTLCAISSNVCDTAPPVCRLITVLPEPQTEIAAEICEGGCWEGEGTTLCTAGNYEFMYQTPFNCDSLVRVTLTVKPTPRTNLDMVICTGDSVQVGDQSYFTAGVFDKNIALPNGCDSIVHLELELIECTLEGYAQGTALPCFGESTGSMVFSLQNGTPPFTYSWRNVTKNQPTGNGNLTALNTAETIQNLPGGLYFITISDGFMNQTVLSAEVTEPSALGADLSTSLYGNFSISCPGMTDGTIQVLANGGTPPYSFVWNTGATDARLENLSAATYTCVVTDARACTYTGAANLSEPPPLQLNAVFFDPNCGGEKTGQINLSSATGGNPPYLFSLNGGVFEQKTRFDSLFGGNYTLAMKDTNGCTTETNGMLTAPVFPFVELGEDLSINLGDSLRLIPLLSSGIDSLGWSPALSLSCASCPSPYAMPLATTTYSLRVVGNIGHCPATDSVTLRVIAVREVYVPNSFSPNDQSSTNNFFTVYGGASVKSIKRLEVYSRWGELVFQNADFRPNTESEGWDGQHRGKDAQTGTYVWTAVVEFVDGVESELKGDVLLVR